MLLHTRTIVIVGTALIIAVMSALYSHAPMPAPLAKAHSQLAVLRGADGCLSCHHEDGLDQGCLSCHQEIASGLLKGDSWHAFQAKEGRSRCADCHQEHRGEEFKLIHEQSWGAQVERSFRHPHVEFGLEGKHLALSCDECHGSEPVAVLASYPETMRSKSFLGLSQDCQKCHDDPHAQGATGLCGDCHNQHEFREPKFDHNKHFLIEGAHVGLNCESCHKFPTQEQHQQTLFKLASQGKKQPSYPYPFDQTRGQACAECHESPHVIDFDTDCTTCHQSLDLAWMDAQQRMTPELHLFTGFPLVDQHRNVDCDSCHPSEKTFNQRHANPFAEGYERKPDLCQGCHQDEHAGQFASRSDSCLDCHSSHSFKPTTLGQADHDSHFPLHGAHAAVPCVDCHTKDAHGVRQFVGVTKSCKSCHDDPHAGQFAQQVAEEDCVACHSDLAQSFRILPFDHRTQAGHELHGAHAEADCSGCHKAIPYEVGAVTVHAVRFIDTPKDCSSCHEDVHFGQFPNAKDCSDCHKSQNHWGGISFDHDTQSNFKLVGRHRDLECSQCHTQEEWPDGRSAIRFTPKGTECKDCHDIEQK